MNVVSFKNGALIAVAAGTLFAAACKKADEKKVDNVDMKAGETKPAGDMKPGETKPAGDMKAEEGQPAGDMKAGEKTAKVHCMGVNSCKGKSECKTANNACAGQNGCGGKGFIDMAEEECKAKGGTIMAKN
jgi:hypothetical protein